MSRYKILSDLGLRSDQFQDKVVLVTGGARGIGEVAARFLSSLGAKIIVADISHRGHALVDELTAGGGDAVFIHTDISSLDSIDHLVHSAVQRFGRIDILLNSAARLKVGTIGDFCADSWDDSYYTLLRGPTYLISKLLPGMLQRKYGVILALISLEGAPFVASYCAQKMALRSVLISLGRELPPETGVSCVAVVPGSVDTPLIHEVIDAIAAVSEAPAQAVMDSLKDNPGYEGLVPPEHSAASCLYIIAHAEKYHGQFVDGYLPIHEHGIINLHENTTEGSIPPPSGDLVRLPNPKQELSAFVKTNLEIERRVKNRTTMLEQEVNQLHRKSLTDALTGLPNRLLLEDRLKHALAAAKRDKSRLALVFIDIDEFKPVNDTYGHHIGDLLLQEAAMRMQGQLRETDTIARLGGDEFVVLLSVVDDTQDVIAVAEKIRTAINQPFHLAEICMHISASIGAAIYPDHGDDEQTLLMKSDVAMYAAKSCGRNNVQLPDFETDDLNKAKEPLNK